jgi:hypothetical protein
MRRYFESRVQLNPAGGRAFSAVINLAWLKGSPQATRCTFKIPPFSFKKATHRPSGESWGLANAGFPKNSSRSIKLDPSEDSPEPTFLPQPIPQQTHTASHGRRRHL